MQFLFLWVKMMKDKCKCKCKACIWVVKINDKKWYCPFNHCITKQQVILDESSINKTNTTRQCNKVL